VPQRYHRVWVESVVDGEGIALDIAFGVAPPHDDNDNNGSRRGEVHDWTKPVYLILHGLNGRSDEEYVKEFVVRKTGEGHTCIVMIARGLMDTPVRGWNVFHGARTSDIELTSSLIHTALHTHHQHPSTHTPNSSPV